MPPARRRTRPRLLRSLRARLLLLFGALAVGPLLTVGVFDYFRSQRLVDNVIITQTDTIARRAAANIADRYGVIASDILLLGENADIQDFLRARGRGDSTEVATAAKRATAFLAAAWRAESLTYHVIEFRDTTGGLLFKLGDGRERGFHDAEPILRVPLRDLSSRRNAGSLILEPRSEVLLSADILGPAFGRTGNILVIDRAADRVVVSRGAPLSTQSARAVFGADWSRFTDTTTAGSLAFETRGGRRIGSFVNLAVPAWTVVSSTAESELAGTFARTRAIDAFFLLALAGLVAIAFVFLVGRATRSLEELTRAAAKVGEGDLDPALPQPTLDEVGTLTRAFAQMLGRVRDMMREIEVSRQLAVLGEFAAQLSHEVRNPLTSLKLDLQGMQRRVKTGELAADAAPAIESALREINRLDTVVRGVLELARQQPIARERCSVHETLDAALDGLRAQLGERCIDVERCFEANEASVSGDRNLLAGMFMNLLLNASQAQPNGGAIGIRASNRDVDGAHWIDVTIADNGPGIPFARRDEVFRPFQTSRHDGTGLGLPLALRTAREHGGHIAIVDPPAGYTGAAFIVSLPLDVP